MARQVTRAWLALAILTACGAALAACSAVIDSSRYVGPGRDGGEPDSGIPPNAPSTPEIRIEPSAPRTTDDLEVVITTESTDPESGTVAYEYRWERDGEHAVEHDASTVPADATAVGERWRVEVTPVADPGARRGAPATAEVTIGNTPPILTTVALDNYAPAVGETVRATPGPTIDPDSATRSVRYQWRRNDMPISGATSTLLATAALSAGDQISLEAWSDDGIDEGPHITIGPIELVDDDTRWRPVAPNGFDDFVQVFYDAPHRRHVRFDGRHLWEHWVSGTNVRTAPIPLRGAAPVSAGEPWVVQHDVVNRRLVVLERDGASEVYFLDLTRRGGERWSSVTPEGEMPIARRAAASFCDAAEGKLWLYGGLNDTVPDRFGDELYSLDLTPGFERWTRHELTGTVPPALMGAAMVADPTTTGAALLMGGLASRGGDFFETSSAVFRLRLAPTSVAVEELSTPLPSPAYGLSAMAIGERILLAGGTTEFGSLAAGFGIGFFDPATGTFARSPTSAPPGAGGSLDLDPDDDGRLLFWRGLVGDDVGGDGSGVGFELRAIDRSSGELSVVAIEQRAPRLSDASVAISSGEMVMLNGRLADGRASPLVWHLGLRTGEWSSSTPMPDSVTETSPGPRFGTMMSGATTWNRPILFAGASDASTFEDTQVWELLHEGRWLLRTLTGASPVPPARIGAGLISAGCSVAHYFGGQSAAGTLLADSGRLACTDLRSCTWQPAAAGGSAPSARSYAAMGADASSSLVWLVGGRTATGPSNEAFSYSACSGDAAPWNAVTTTGTSPPGRYAHSMVLIPGAGGAVDSFIVFGGTHDASTTLNDAWRLELTSSTTARWVALAPAGDAPVARAYHHAVWDSGGNRMLVFGGRATDDTNTLGDVWELIVRP